MNGHQGSQECLTHKHFELQTTTVLQKIGLHPGPSQYTGVAKVSSPSYPHNIRFGWIKTKVPTIPCVHSNIQGTAWRGQSPAQRPLRVCYRTCRPGMSSDCRARHCWTWARRRPHTARAPGTALYPASAWWWKGPWDSSQCQNNPERQKGLSLGDAKPQM